MLGFSVISSKRAFQKINLIAQEIGLTVIEIASILELDIDLVWLVINNGHLPPNLPNPSEIFDKFYQLLFILNYSLKMSDYDQSEIRKLWLEVYMYNATTIKPPWYPRGLKRYLLDNRYRGLTRCVDWLKEY